MEPRLALPAPTAALALTALLTLSFGGLVGAAAPAQAHPFGDPQQLDVTATDAGVAVHWRAADDDLTSLALRLDVLDGPRSQVYRDGALVPERTESADAELLSASPRLEDYLLARVEVLAAGTPCAGSLVSADDLAQRGAFLEYDCPVADEALDAVTVRARLLTDLHAAYRTLATGPGGATHVFTVSSETHEFGLGDAVPDGPTTAGSGVALVAWAGAGASALALTSLVLRRRRRGVA